MRIAARCAAVLAFFFKLSVVICADPDPAQRAEREPDAEPRRRRAQVLARVQGRRRRVSRQEPRAPVSLHVCCSFSAVLRPAPHATHGASLSRAAPAPRVPRRSRPAGADAIPLMSSRLCVDSGWGLRSVYGTTAAALPRAWHPALRPPAPVLRPPRCASLASFSIDSFYIGNC
jgi:hypothetical protein